MIYYIIYDNRISWIDYGWCRMIIVPLYNILTEMENTNNYILFFQFTMNAVCGHCNAR